MEEHFLIRSLEWASERTEGFTYNDFINSVSLIGWEKTVIEKHFKFARENTQRKIVPTYPEITETIFYHIQDDRYTLTTEALFKYIDYAELKIARLNATEAKRHATTAIRVSMSALIVSLLVPFFVAKFFTQTVVVAEDQVYRLEEKINTLITLQQTILQSSSVK